MRSWFLGLAYVFSLERRRLAGRADYEGDEVRGTRSGLNDGVGNGSKHVLRPFIEECL